MSTPPYTHGQCGGHVEKKGRASCVSQEASHSSRGAAGVVVGVVGRKDEEGKEEGWGG